MGVVTAMVFGAAACGTKGQDSANEDTKAETSDTEENKDDSSETKTASYQFIGKYSGLEDHNIGYAMKMNLYDDGTVEMDRYNYLMRGTEESDMTEEEAEEKAYEKAYMTGTWEEGEKDGVECLEITVHAVDEDGNEINEITCYAYDTDGTYGFELTFPLIPGMKYTRAVEMTGNSQMQYADDDTFAAAYKVSE